MTSENHSLVEGESVSVATSPVDAGAQKKATNFQIQQGGGVVESSPQKNEGWTIAEAAEQLYVSERTVRRYLQSRKLSGFQFGSQTLVSRQSLSQFIQKYHPELVALHARMSKAQGSQSVSNTPQPQGAPVAALSPIGNANANANESKPVEPKTDESTRIYRHLYENTLTKLTEAQKRLEGANYRVGELENQLKNTVPLLDYTRTQSQLKELEGSVERFQREANESTEINHRLVKEYSEVKDKYSLAKAKGYLYLLLLIAVLVAGSFWLVLQQA